MSNQLELTKERIRNLKHELLVQNIARIVIERDILRDYLRKLTGSSRGGDVCILSDDGKLIEVIVGGVETQMPESWTEGWVCIRLHHIKANGKRSVNGYTLGVQNMTLLKSHVCDETDYPSLKKKRAKEVS